MLMRFITPFTLIFTIISFTLSAQDSEGEHPVPYDADKNKIIYQDVVKVQGVDKKTLFERFDEWGKQYYRNYDGKIEAKKKDMNPPLLEIGSWAELDYETMKSERIKYRLKVQFKENRYRYEIYKLHRDKGYFFGLENWIDPKQGSKEKMNEKLKTLDQKMNEIISDMKDYIADPPEEEEDNW